MDPGNDPRAEGARSAFSGAVQQHMTELAGGQQQADDPPFVPQDPATLTPAPAAKATRKRRSAAEQVAEVDNGGDVSFAVKAEILKVAFNDSTTSLDDGLEIAGSLLEWVRSA